MYNDNLNINNFENVACFGIMSKSDLSLEGILRYCWRHNAKTTSLHFKINKNMRPDRCRSIGNTVINPSTPTVRGSRSDVIVNTGWNKVYNERDIFPIVHTRNEHRWHVCQRLVQSQALQQLDDEVNEGWRAQWIVPQFLSSSHAAYLLWSCDKVYHKQEVCFLLYFLS